MITKRSFEHAAAIVSAIRVGQWTHDAPRWVPAHLDGTRNGVDNPIEVSTPNEGNLNVDVVRAIWTAEAFIVLFRESNPQFDQGRFLKACGLAS